MREYVIVEETGEHYFVVRTTTDELYRIDAEYNVGLEAGDLALVIYDPANKVQDGDGYRVTPTLVEESTADVTMSTAG